MRNSKYDFNEPNRQYNDWDSVEQQLLKRLDEEGYTKAETDALLAEKADVEDVEALEEDKVDKVEGKGLSTNDFTDEDKAQIQQNKEDIADITSVLPTKVDKEDGKGLSSNDFTNGWQTQISDNTNRINDAEGRITDTEGSIESINTHISGTDETIADILLDIGQDIISGIGTSIKNAIVNLKTLIDGKQDILTPENGIDITADKKIKVKIDGTTIKVNEQGNLWADTNGSGQHGYEPDQQHGLRLYDDMMGVKVDGVSVDFNENGELKCFGGGGSGDGYLDGGTANAIYQVGDTVDGGYANSF